MREARMDIDKSQLGYLGYDDSEAWGVSYKARGFCNDDINPEGFEAVGVFGNIHDSETSHNYYGLYSYGHQNGDWSRNISHGNVQYG